MSDFKRLIAGIGCRDGKAVRLNQPGEELAMSLLEFAHFCNDNGADGLMIHDFSETDEDHESSIGLIKKAAREIDIPIITGGRVKRMEDVKKYLYAGAKAVFLDGGNDDNVDLIKEVSDRFGSEKIYVTVSSADEAKRIPEFVQLGASTMVLAEGDAASDDFDLVKTAAAGNTPCLLMCGELSAEAIKAAMAAGNAAGVIVMTPTAQDGHYMELKQQLGALGEPVDILKSSVSWADFKTNADGLVPVIVQDFKTSEVLMLAYMNEEAFADTLRTGKMHYYSRSRQSQWLKGETSGHFQYVKSLHLDCDNDTVLAKVHQIGAACHTGSRSCFFQTLAQKEYKETNPLKVFEDVFAVIQDRKIHPKEGSYTNYLFDKGIDKILKKVGEEATEIVIAAKNPDPEEIKYEISDFLYHVMVLMAERGVTWEEITEELANR